MVTIVILSFFLVFFAGVVTGDIWRPSVLARIERILSAIQLASKRAGHKSHYVNLHEIYERAQVIMMKDNLFLQGVKEKQFVSMLGTNRIYFVRALKIYGHCSYPGFVNKMKIRYAVQAFIREPTMTATEMAAVAGYNSLNALTAPFKEEMYMTPGRWCARYRLTGEI